MHNRIPAFRRSTHTLLAAAGLACAAAFALAGGSPENVLIVINPANAESVYLGHYYQFARNIPASNILYIDPAAASYPALAGANGGIDAVFGKLANSKLSDHIDYIVLASGQNFYVNAPGLVTDGCSPVTRFSLTSAYCMAFIRSQILAGGTSSEATNNYYNFTAAAFDSNLAWLNGSVNATAAAKRYFIAAQLGYTGAMGNTVGEITAMIDSAAAADGTHPAGKFYFMNTTDSLRNVRSPAFPSAVNAITTSGGQAEIINGVLPDFRNDCLSIMTGWPDPPVDGSVYTLLPGAYCDDLTSYHATFDQPAQTKMSSWIRRGAAGTCGTVEEPCNYTGKFAAPTLPYVYFKGLSLGEAYLRSIAYIPFQSMFQGDPVTRPFATIPTVAGNAPTGTVSGQITFTPTASTTLSGAAIASLELYINGSLQRSYAPAALVQINTQTLPDGPNELRILAYDNTVNKTAGRWVGTINVNNLGRIVTLGAPLTTGNLSAAFPANISVSGPGAISEVRLVQNGRVLAASPSAPAAFTVYGRNIGAGKSNIQAEVLYTDGTSAISAPILMNIAYSAGAPFGQAPIAYSYTKRVVRGQPFTVELPATYDDDAAGATYTLLTNPAQSVVGAGTGPYRTMTAGTFAWGTDPFTFRVNTPSGQSGTATVTLIYTLPDCYANCDNSTAPPILNANDFQCFLNKFAAGESYANCDNSTAQPIFNANDFQCFLNAFAAGCS